MNSTKDDNLNLSKMLWMEVYVAVAGSSNCTRKTICKSWADQAVDDFLETFDGEKKDE